jgi:hypothetical protein
LLVAFSLQNLDVPLAFSLQKLDVPLAASLQSLTPMISHYDDVMSCDMTL